MTTFARYEAEGVVGYGVVEGERVHRLSGTPFESQEFTGLSHGLEEVRLLAPVAPGKVVAMGLNYESHLREFAARFSRPETPQAFWKPASSVIGPGGRIVLPRGWSRVEAEGEVVAVIGSRCKNVDPEHALEHVLGYTCGNDVSERTWQRDDLQWWRAKGSDTFAPVGPLVATGVEPGGLHVVTRVNGEKKQAGGAEEFIFDLPTIISFVSQAVTLEPGDLVFTGTPGVPPRLHPGDVVEVEVAGVGVLRNPVAVA